jgi:NTE family protein
MRALVLSGGGPLAVAWECGLIAGLAEAAVGIAGADFILGTSAGAIVGAQLAQGRDPAMMTAAILDEAKGVAPPGARPFDPAAVARLPELFAKAQSRPDNPAAARAEVGAYALAQTTESEEAAAARFAALVGTRTWPERGFGCAVVDASDGSVRLLTRDCGASLDRAVAASCSLPGISAPITIEGRPYIDGGFASAANVDLAADHDELLVAVFAPAGPRRERISARLEPQLARLRAAGKRVHLLWPDAACTTAIGEQTMDVRRRPDVARAGLAQGKAESERVREFLEGAAD